MVALTTIHPQEKFLVVAAAVVVDFVLWVDPRASARVDAAKAILQSDSSNLPPIDASNETTTSADACCGWW